MIYPQTLWMKGILSYISWEQKGKEYMCSEKQMSMSFKEVE